MKLDLDKLEFLYEAIDKGYLEEQGITDFTDFKMYVLETIINNIEYDFSIAFNDYVDNNNFVIYD